MTTLQSIAALIAELPHRQEWRAGVSSIRADLKALIRRPQRRPYRVSSGPRPFVVRLRAA